MNGPLLEGSAPWCVSKGLPNRILEHGRELGECLSFLLIGGALSPQTSFILETRDLCRL